MPIEPHEAPRAEWDYELETDVGATDPFIDANGLAYQLVSRMFVWFGYTPRRCAIRGRDGRPSRRDGVRAVALQIALSDASLSVAQRAHILDGHSVRQGARPAAHEPRTAATGRCVRRERRAAIPSDVRVHTGGRVHGWALRQEPNARR